MKSPIYKELLSNSVPNPWKQYLTLLFFDTRNKNQNFITLIYVVIMYKVIINGAGHGAFSDFALLKYHSVISRYGNFITNVFQYDIK